MMKDYPYYFKGNEELIEIKSVGRNKLRLHLKLPYQFTKYDELFAGTAELPDNWAIRSGSTGYKLILLGMTSQYGRHTWMRKGKIV